MLKILLVLVSLLWPFLNSWAEISPLKLTFIDVGHGDCILIQTPDDGVPNNGINEGKIIIIDGGEKREAKRAIIPYLKSHGIPTSTAIDYLIMTHAHSDHVGGLIPIIQTYSIKAILDPGFKAGTGLYRSFVKLAKRERDCHYCCPLVGSLITKEGEQLDWGSELEVRVLNSDKDAEEINNTSIVLRIRYGEVSFLLVGDAEGKDRKDPPSVLKFVEKDLVAVGGELKSTFLKVGHHGSESSSTDAFIDAVSPEYAIICAGNKKFAGTLLPDKTVIERYEKRGIKIFRTDRDDQKKSSSRTSGDDSIVIISDGTRQGTRIKYCNAN